MSEIRTPKHIYHTVEEIQQAAQTMLIDNIESEEPKLVDNSDMYDILYSIANLSKVNAKSPQLNGNGNWITYDEEGAPIATNVSAKGTLISFNEDAVGDAPNIDDAKVKIYSEGNNEIELGQDVYTPETEWFTEMHIKDGWQDDEDYQDIEEIYPNESLGIVNIRTTGGLQIDKTENGNGEDVLLIGSPTRYCRHVIDSNLSTPIETYYPDNTLMSAQYDYIEDESNQYTITPTFISKYNTLHLNINLLFSLYRGSENYQYGSVLANDTISLLIVDGVCENSISTRVNNNLSVFTDRETLGSYGMPMISIPTCAVVEDNINHCFRITPTIVISGWNSEEDPTSYPYFEVNLIGHINNYGISVIDNT